MNSVNLTGRIGQEPKSHEFDNGDTVTNLSIAVDDGYYDRKKEEWVERTEWVNISINKKSKLTKGDLIEVSGKIRTRSYEKDGDKRYATEVVAHSTKLLSRPTINAMSDQLDKLDNQPTGSDDDDLPF